MTYLCISFENENISANPDACDAFTGGHLHAKSSDSNSNPLHTSMQRMEKISPNSPQAPLDHVKEKEEVKANKPDVNSVSSRTQSEATGAAAN